MSLPATKVSSALSASKKGRRVKRMSMSRSERASRSSEITDCKSEVGVSLADDPDQKNKQRKHVVMGASAKVSHTAYAALKLIEDIPENDRTMGQKLRLGAHHVLDSTRFDRSIGIILLVNSFFIGYQADLDAKGKKNDIWLELLDLAFLIVYTIELVLRYFVHGVHAFRNEWVFFDLIHIAFSWGVVVLVNLLRDASQGGAFLAVFRLFRIGKLIRPLRVIAQFRALWLLVRGLITTALTVIYTFLLLALFLYIFACLGIELIAKDYTMREEDPEYDAIVTQFFPSLWTTIVSLSQFITCDSIAAIYRDIVLKRPWLMGYFTALVLLLSVSLMNLVTALIVEGAQAQSAAEKTIEREIRLREFDDKTPRLLEIFHGIDSDGSGSISISEILSISAEDADFLFNVIPADNMAELFHILDTDASGEILYDEFMDSLREILASDLPIPTVRLLKESSVTRAGIIEIKDRLALVQGAAGIV
jgi:voltage-gated sodium channel